MEDGQVQSYRDLRVWNEAMVLAETCYRHTRNFPKDELFGLTSQIRRAAVSIPANIAEGYGRLQTGAYVQFLRIAQGSCKELETHLILASRVLHGEAAKPEPLLDQAEVVGKMLRGLIRSLKVRLADCRLPTAFRPRKWAARRMPAAQVQGGNAIYHGI